MACSLWARLRGLKRLGDFRDALLLAPCSDVHTFGMKRPIDIAFIGADGRVLRSHRAVPPQRRRRCRGAVAVLERYAAEDPWPEGGDRLGLNEWRDDRGR